MTRKHKLPLALLAVFAMTLALLVYFPSGAFCGFDMGMTASAAWNGTAADGFAGGDGSAASPFEIANGEQLAYFEKQVNGGKNYSYKYIKLTANIDLGGREWKPIGFDGQFEGSFDGDGHTVSNFIINKSGYSKVGLFGEALGTIKNLGVENAEVTGDDYVGGICGCNGGTIANCYVEATVRGNNYIGGICGINYGTVTNCYNAGAVGGTRLVGGICGSSSDTITNCYNSATVSGTEYVGGVCGENSLTSESVEKSYNTGKVSGTNYVGGVCGGNSSTVTNCYYNKDICTVGGISGSDADGSATGLTTDELCGELPNGFANYVWIKGSIDPVTDSKNPKLRTFTYTFPSLKGVGEAYIISEKQYNFSINGNEDWQEYTLISTAEEFKAFIKDSSAWGKNYILGADIDLGGAEITPIGEFKPNYIFTGKFSGNGHTVSNFKINKPDNDQIGLFGYSEGLIMELGVENAEVTGSEDVGSICGYNAGTITDCHNAATVNGNSYIGGICGRNEGTITDCHNAATVNGYSDVGGISGRNVKINGSIGIIINCYNSGSVKGNDSFIGGVCGENYNGTIENSYNTGAVSGKNQVGGVCGVSTGIITNSYNTGTVNGTNGVGGVCGGTTRNEIDSPSITNCYNTGAVSGEESIGGVCGSCNENIIKNCYNTGAVTGSGLIIGGICGYSSDGSTISSCYNTGAVSGNSWGFGGVCGERESSAVITNCYYNKDICTVGGIDDSDVDGSATGLTTDELCNGLPEGFESSVWVGGDHKFAYNSDNERMRSAEYSFPCFRSVGKAYTVRKKLYNFISYTDDSSDWQEYTLISTADEFKAIGEDSSNWSKNYVLGADIDLGGAEITPIGNSTTKFTGKFSGDGHIVSNFKINKPRSQYVGLFGSIDNLITDLSIENAAVEGYYYVGGICGKNYGAIQNCSSAASVKGCSYVSGVCGYNEESKRIINCYNTGTVSGTEYVGGVCGENKSGTVSNCYNTGAVSGTDYIAGVCGYNDGTIIKCYNTGDISAENGANCIGGVCGSNKNGTITDCYNSGSADGKNAIGVGGVCGENKGGTVSNCYNTGAVSEGNLVGGICGDNSRGSDGISTVKNSYNTGSVNGNEGVGGVCGLSDGSIITNCYNIGEVSGNSNVGGICGNNNGTVTNCYYNKNVCTAGGINGEDVEGSATGLTSDELCSGLPNGFDSSVWTAGSIDPSIDSKNPRLRTATYIFPSLTGVGEAYSVSDIKQYNFGINGNDDWQKYTLISTAEEFKAITKDGADLKKNYVLGADIDLKGAAIEPIGTDIGADTSFTGKFSGDGHTVSNFKINKPKDGYVGLFNLRRGLVMNLGVENAEVTGSDKVGGICGCNNCGTIINCYFAGTVSGNDCVGGICGMSKGTIANCYNAGKVSGNGVCGYYVSGDITNCYYNKDICPEVDKYATGLTTLQMTDSNALKTMNLDIEVWSKTANDTENKIAYYPELKAVKGSRPSVKYETKLDISVADGDGSEETKLNISALVKFDGMTEFKADETALTSGKGSFTVSLFDETLVPSTDIYDNTTVTVTVPRVDQIDEPDLTLTYNAGTSCFFSDSSRKLLDGAVAVYDGSETKAFDDLTSALKAYKASTKPLTINLREDAEVKTLAIPTKAQSITFAGRGKLIFSGTSITFPTDTTINIDIVGTNAKPFAVKSAVNKSLTLNKSIEKLGNLGGTATSTLNINADITAARISTFKEINIAEGKILTSNGNVSGVVLLNGTLKLTNPKSTAVITNIGNAKLMFADTNGTIAKATVKDINTALEIAVVDEEGTVLTLDSGRTVLWAGGNINFTEKITIENTTAASKTLNAFLYAKDIRAEYAGTLTLSDGTTSTNYPNFELALKEMTDKTKDYVVTVNENTSTAKFVLPTLTKAQSVTIKSENEAKTITLTNITAVSAKTPLKLENIKLESTKPYTISTTSDLTLDRFASDSITSVRGGAKATLTLGETTPIDKVSGFGTTKITNNFTTGTTFTTTDLELAETANLVVSNTKAPATAKTLNGAEGSVITLDTNFTPIKVTGTTADSISGTIKLKAAEAIDENTVLFTTKYAGNNVFDVTEIKPETELDYTVTSISGKAYMKPIVFEMNNTGYALWTDVMTVIENVKMSEAQYTVKLLDDADINGAMKLPKAGTYGKLTISSESKTLTFTGSITATGELEIANTNLISARNTTSSKYTISAGKYQFAAENADLSLASITSTADVTLKNIRTSGTVRAEKLTLNGEDTILGTITANELGSTEEGTVLNILSNTRGVMRITKNGIAENSEEITIKLVDESENAVMAENLSIIASSFTGNYSGELKLSTENGEFSIILSRNKLVLADSFTAANGLLEADEEESDDTDTSEEEPAEETPEDNSDDAPSEEDAPNDGDTSDNDINEETESSDMTEELSA